MSRAAAARAVGPLSFIAGLALALSVIAPAPTWAQQAGTDAGEHTVRAARPGAAAPGRRRCPSCAPIPASSGAPAAAVSARRGGGHTPSTDAAVMLGTRRYQGRVDADCEVRGGAPVGGPRMYYLVMYPWFGRPLGPDEPKWRFDLEIVRGPVPGVYRHFVFSFHDGPASGTIQVLPGATRYGKGTVRVTPHPPGARFDVEGVSDTGVPLRATIDCVGFESSEAAGG